MFQLLRYRFKAFFCHPARPWAIEVVREPMVAEGHAGGWPFACASPVWSVEWRPAL
jgi:hypothetical protein